MAKYTLKEINIKTVELVKGIKTLESISWPNSLEKFFFSELEKRNRPILKFKYKKNNFYEIESELKKLIPHLSQNEPTHLYTKSTIESYLNAIDMIHSVGTQKFQDKSIIEYGLPTHKLFGSQYSHLDTAKSILKSYHEFDHPYLEDSSNEYSGKDLRNYLKKESKRFFKEYCPKFHLKESMTAKASAGRTSVSIRKNAIFSKYDFDQLLVHEIMTHSLTGINGGLQENLTLMAKGAPRTTKTQEGLATFSEVITGNMDLARLKRLALRVIAMDMALRGADFYELFDFFVKNEQTQQESYFSTSRILRGGFPGGGIVFTKDATYLEGLIRVHSFFRWAFKTSNLDLAHLIFCGRLDINDIFLLKDAYRSKQINPPRFLPQWYQNIDLFAGKMAFSVLLNGIDMENVEKHYSSKLQSL